MICVGFNYWKRKKDDTFLFDAIMKEREDYMKLEKEKVVMDFFKAVLSLKDKEE